MSRMYQESVYEGYLTKSPPRMNRKWQRRYFVLLPHQKLMYFSKCNGERKGIIDLDRVQEILFDLYLDKGPSNVISLEVKGTSEDPSRPRQVPDRIYYLLADSRDEMEVWHKHLMEVADLQLCRKNNVVADSTQGDEYYISARRRTAIEKEGADKRGMVNSFHPDSNVPEYGTYSRTDADLSQSTHLGESYGLYASTQSQPLSEISISVGEDSSSDEEEFTRPDNPDKPATTRLPKSPNLKTTNATNTPRMAKQNSIIGVQSLPLSPPEEETRPSLPPRRKEQMFPDELSFDLPLPPQRVSSQKRLQSPCYPAPSPAADRPVARDRKSMFSRGIIKSEESNSLNPANRRPAAKMPSIPVNVLLTTVKEVPSVTPVPKPRRPTSYEGSLSDTPTSPVGIAPYKTVKRCSEVFPDEEPIYANDQPDHGYINVDPRDGTYVKFDPVSSEGAYVSISRDPMDAKKLATTTDTSGYAKIVEPKPRSKMPLPRDNRNACESNQ